MSNDASSLGQRAEIVVSRSNTYWILAAILTIYLISQITMLNKPGIQQDEAVFLTPSMELAQGRPISYSNSVTIFGIQYPTMLGAYTGNSLTLPVAITVQIFGFSLELVRLLWVIVGAGTILFTFLVGQELFNAAVGLIAAAFLAINPTFWMFSHVGAHASASMTLDVVASLYFFLVYYRKRRWWELFLAMYFTGHGLYTKLAFGYFLLAYLLMFGYLWLRRKVRRDVVNLQGIAVSIPAFLLGCWPLLYDLTVNFGPLKALAKSLLGSQLSGQSNLDVGQSLLIRLDQTRSYLLEGRMPIGSIVPGIPVTYNSVMPYVFFGGLIFLVVAMIWPGRRIFDKERIGFVVLVVCLFQVLIIFSPSTLNYGVYVFIPPFIALILALAFYLAYKFLGRWQYRRLHWLSAAGLVLVMLTEAVTLASHYDAVRTSGGRGVWSSTIFDLNAYLHQNMDRNAVALDWGLDYPIYVLSNLQIKPSSAYIPFTNENGVLTMWQNAPPPSFNGAMENLISQPRNLYLARAEQFASFKGRLATLKQIVAENGGQLMEVHRIPEANGQEFIQVYEVQWPSGKPPVLNADDLLKGSPPRSGYPQLNNLYPDRAVAGSSINPQPNGRSAIAVAGTGFMPDSVVYFGDQPLETTYGSTELLTAIVPDVFLNSPGEIKVTVINRHRLQSNALTLTIVPQ